MANTSNQSKPQNGLFNFLLLAGVALSLGVLMQVPTADAATYTVSNTNDAGAGSLRQAIIDANGNAGILDTIDFSVSGTVNIQSDLPAFSEAAAVDGRTAPNNLGGADFIIGAAGRTYCLQFNAGAGNVVRGIGCQGGSQQGFIFQTNVTGATVGGTDVRDGNEIQATTGAGIQVSGADNVTIINTKIGTGTGCFKGITVNGGGGTVTGLVIGGSGVNERNVIVNSTQHGIEILDASGVIKGNYIGTDGNNDNGNAQAGIMVGSGNTNLVIGGVNAGEGNVISGNNWSGILISLSGSVTVQGNYIGTNAAGNAAIANSQKGIEIQTSNNVIGGSTAGARNIISGNTQHGIAVDPLGGNITGNSIKGNYIGLNSSGNGAIGNGQAGIAIGNGTITNTSIGGVNAGEGNVISGNSADGIGINSSGVTGTTIYGNVIGLQVDKVTSAPNATGILVNGDNTTIGQINVAGSRNIIASNNSYGININGADNTVVVNNYIGIAGDGVTQRVHNNQAAIEISSTGASNTIGGTATGAQNLIATPANKSCVLLQGTAGNFNNIRQNTCLNSSGQIKTQAPSNESIIAPSISTATGSYVQGSSIASGNVDIFVNGTFLGTVTANASGAWEKHLSITPNSSVTATVTNGSLSTSSSSTAVTSTYDSTAPADPTVSTPADSTVVTSTPITITGTKEANTSIWFNGIQQVSNDALTTWTVAGVALVEGQNNINVSAKDFSSNASNNVLYTITLDTIVPTTPTLSYPSSAANTVTILGSGTESEATVLINGVAYAYVDGLGNFSVNYPLQAGTNNLSITIQDAGGNTSTPAVAVVTNGASGGSSSSGGGGGSSGSSSGPIVGNDDEDQNAMAGEEEEDPVVDVNPEEDTDTPNPTTEPTDTTSGSTDQTPSNTTSGTSGTPTENTTVKTTEPVKSFYSGIYTYVEPIKVQTVRDTFPQKPILPPRFNEKVLGSKLFGNKNELGVPQILIDIKGKGKDLTATRDSDGDGAYDWEEILSGANPDVKDTDGDGRSDGDELFIDGTNPASYDSDGDGISDLNDKTATVYTKPEVSAQEIVDYIEEVKLTEPVGQVDSDGDGLSDLDEIYKGIDPQVADTDGDGLDDGYEVFSLGSDPTSITPESAVDQISVVNVSGGGGSYESGTQLYTGHADAEVTISAYEIDENGEMILIGQTKTDENGSYVLMTSKELPAGKHTIVLTTGESLNALTDISLPIEINLVDYVKKPQFAGLGLEDGDFTTETRPTLSLTALSDYKIVILWKSTVNGQTLIADASDQTLNARPVENLELGEHTVTWYAEDLKTGDKSAPTQIAFNVTNTAFVTGETGTSPWTIALGSIAVLASLTALALFYRNRKIEA